MKQSDRSIGVDVAKDNMVVAVCDEGKWASRTLLNQAAALRAWLRELPRGSRIGMEATGSYHQRLADLAARAGFTVYVLNPRDLRHYAHAVGLRAKTDRVDAELIARYIQREHSHLHAYVPPSREQRTLDSLLKRRAKLTALKGALRATLSPLPGLRRELDATLARFDRLLARIDERMGQLQAAIPQRQAQLTRLCSIVGVGPLVGTWMANVLSRMSFTNGDALIAFLGLDPRPCDSGRRHGRRRLSKRGPAEGRRLMFNSAMSAVKTTTWRPLYEHYRARGLATTTALIIIARKIARIAFALWRSGTNFDCNRVIHA